MSSFDFCDDLSLYIHFPWCIGKCPYCDFNSHEIRGEIDENRYINTLIRDFDQAMDSLKERRFKSIFLGGGTPSLFSGKSLQSLIKHVTNRADCRENMEVTLEANPGTLEHDQFSRYLEAGINRLSLGVQSFDDACLTRIGRIHNVEAVYKALDNARKSGFSNINIDIMFGLPDQSIDMAIEDCQKAIDCDIEHISCYQLTLEPNTRFYLDPPNLPDHDTIYRMETRLQPLLEKHGFIQYEVSAYAQPGKRCNHNMHYWAFGDYLGIGAGAHSKISNDHRIIRCWNEKHPKHYQDKVENNTSWKNCQSVAGDDIMLEFLMNALRIKEGFRLELFERRTFINREALLSCIKPFFDDGLLTLNNNKLRCSKKGYLFIDEILGRLCP